MKKLQIGIIGSAGSEEYPQDYKPQKNLYKTAYELGKLVAKKGAILVTGGKSGIMEEASKGAKKNGGITIGVVKGNLRNTANKYIDIEVVTGMAATGGEFILVLMCDILVIVGGGAGTLQEATIAYRNGKPIFAIKGTGGWADKLTNIYLDERKNIKIIGVNSVNEIKKIIKKYE